MDKGGNGTVFIPLTPDDPLYVPGGHSNFMILTRATNLPGPDGILGTADDVHQGTNQTSPFVDQSQTYASDPSHQVFLREYMIGADGKLHSTGALLGHVKADGKDGMATWGDLKAKPQSSWASAHRRGRRQRAAAGDRRLRQFHSRRERAAAARGPQCRRHHQSASRATSPARSPVATDARFALDMPSSTTWRMPPRPPTISASRLQPDTGLALGQSSRWHRLPSRLRQRTVGRALRGRRRPGERKHRLDRGAGHLPFRARPPAGQIKQTVQDQLNAGDSGFAGQLGAARRQPRDRAAQMASPPRDRCQRVERRAAVPGGEVRHRDRIPAHRVRGVRPLRGALDPRLRRRQRAHRCGDHIGVRQRRLSLRPFDAGRERQPLPARRGRKAGDRSPTASR